MCQLTENKLPKLKLKKIIQQNYSQPQGQPQYKLRQVVLIYVDHYIIYGDFDIGCTPPPQKKKNFYPSSLINDPNVKVKEIPIKTLHVGGELKVKIFSQPLIVAVENVRGSTVLQKYIQPPSIWSFTIMFSN